MRGDVEKKRSERNQGAYPKPSPKLLHGVASGYHMTSFGPNQEA